MEHCLEVIDTYEADPTHPHAALYVDVYCRRYEALQRLEFQQTKNNDYEQSNRPTGEW